MRTRETIHRAHWTNGPITANVRRTPGVFPDVNPLIWGVIMAYQAPSIKSVGSIADLTLAEGGNGNDDRFLFFTWGTEVS